MHHDPVGPHLPLRASGEFLEHQWAYHAAIIGNAAHDWVSITAPDGSGSGGGGGGGALPFADLGWRVLGPIGSSGYSQGNWSRRWFRKRYCPGHLNGVVSHTVAAVRVEFEQQSKRDALLIDSGHPEFRFFFLPLEPRVSWTRIVALDADGAECDVFVRPPDH
jgi:hypothetical protein